MWREKIISKKRVDNLKAAEKLLDSMIEFQNEHLNFLEQLKYYLLKSIMSNSNFAEIRKVKKIL